MKALKQCLKQWFILALILDIGLLSSLGAMWPPQGSGGATSVAWGGISGNLSDQSDLNTVLNGKVTSVNGSGAISSTAGTTPIISIATANTSTTGAISSTDWNSFNARLSQGGSANISALTAATGRTATKVIAPSNASTNDTNQADVVLTGTADQNAIQSVINSISRGIVYIDAGLVSVTGNFSLKSNIQLWGAGDNATIIKLADSSNFSGSLITYSGTTIDSSGVFDLQIDGNQPNQGGLGDVSGVSWHGSYNRFERVYIHDLVQGGVGSQGIVFTGDYNSYNTVRDSKFKDTQFSAIYFAGAAFHSNGNQILNNTIWWTYDSQFDQQCYGAVALGNDNLFDGNTFDFTYATFTGAMPSNNVNAIVWQGLRNKAYHNTTINCWMDGIYANGNESQVISNVIKRVHAKSGVAYGINLVNSQNSTASLNYLEDVEIYAIQATGGGSMIVGNKSVLTQVLGSASFVALGSSGNNVVVGNYADYYLYGVNSPASTDTIWGNPVYTSIGTGVATMLINTGMIAVSGTLSGGLVPVAVFVTASSNPGVATTFWTDTFAAGGGAFISMPRPMSRRRRQYSTGSWALPTSKGGEGMSDFWQWFIGTGVAVNIIISAFWLGTLHQNVKDMKEVIGKLPCLDPKGKCEVKR